MAPGVCTAHWSVMAMTVWVDRWQLDCCGEPFLIGSRVSWTLRYDRDFTWLADVLGPEIAIDVDASEEHHGAAEDAVPTKGTVSRITQVHCRYGPHPMPDSALLTTVTEARKWVRDHGDRQFAGFLVRLNQDHET
jgi:hypothetical protein